MFRFQWVGGILLILVVSEFQLSRASVSTVVSLAVTALETTIERANKVSDSLKNDNDITPGDVILSFMETIPVVGDIIRLFKGQDEDETKEIMNKILAQLTTLSQLQTETLVFLQNLDNKINLVVLKNQIATSSKIINSCYTDLIHFLKNPSSLADTDRFLKCYYSIMTEVRHIGRILEEKEFSLESPKLFSYIIQQDKYCNGTNIVNTYKYLFGLHFLGCETAVLAEAVKYGNTSRTFSTECLTSIKNIEKHMMSIYSVCTRDTCDRVIGVLKSVIGSHYNKPVERIAGEILVRLPWFFFTVFKFNRNPGGQMTGNFLPSYVTIHHGHTYFIILWTPFNTLLKSDDTTVSFVLEFDATHFDSDYRGMHVNRNIARKPAMVIGHFNNNVTKVSYSRCTKTSKITLAPEPGHILNAKSDSGKISSVNVVLVLSIAVLHLFDRVINMIS
ncbi:uncharacterized protein LOC127715999 [Mytilus californianus]|uniref:uncharacterized protein LOC127715999 n=1 Tax=Mytilus californianus TaxID=6549 RepID=UPI002245AE8A|nr:uncharacterized protein LOC127715999 [Mytilus californianus]